MTKNQAMPNAQRHDPDPALLDLRHLQAALKCLDARVGREVRRWQRAGQDPTDAFRGMYVSDAEADALLTRALGTGWGDTVTLDAAEEQAFEAAREHAVAQAQVLSDAIQHDGHVPRLEQLAKAFELDRFDVDTLLICLAPTLDLRYERLYGYLQDDVTRKRPGINLVLNLLCEPGFERLLNLAHFADDAPLFKYHILERVAEPGHPKPPLLGQSLVVDDGIVAWLLGRYQPLAELGSRANLTSPEDNGDDHLLAAQAWATIEKTFDAQSIIVFYGPDQLGQHAAARLLAAHVGRPLLSVDLAEAANPDLSPLRTLTLALRDARLTGAVPYLTGWDACLSDGVPLPGMLAALVAFPHLAIVAGQSLWKAGGIEGARIFIRTEFPMPGYALRRTLWLHFLKNGSLDKALDVNGLAGQFLLTTGQIRDAVVEAREAARQSGGTPDLDDLFAAARVHSNSHLASLARKITPRYGWSDIVLPADQLDILREIIASVRGRPRVLDEWGVGCKLASSSGVTVLFAGPPGTGKTMAAEIIAAELGLDLYKIDLSTIVSKYIGETEKNLERIFGEAASSNAILFFDEADALFGKRSEVRDSHDRYANIEVSYLLQRMEAYDGVTILATNLRASLDEAFTRRLQFAVDFPFPDEKDRLRIWQTLFPPAVPRASLDLALLARRYKLAGGNIRNIIVGAAYLAADDGGVVTMEHLLHGTRRELQKMGRLIGEGEPTVTS